MKNEPYPFSDCGFLIEFVQFLRLESIINKEGLELIDLAIEKKFNAQLLSFALLLFA